MIQDNMARAYYKETKRLVLEKLEDNLYEVAEFLNLKR